MKCENEKKKYVEPTVEIIEFETEDVITTSGNEAEPLGLNW